MAKTEAKSTSKALAAYMKQREEGDLSYLSEQVIYILSLEDFLVLEQNRNGCSLENEFTVTKKDITVSIFVTFLNGNIIVKSPTGRTIDKVKFNLAAPSRVAGLLFGEWIQTLSESM